MLTVLIAENHAEVRKGLKDILEAHRLAGRIDEVQDGEAALFKALQNSYDVVLMDISLPGRNGIEITREIKGIQSPPAVLIISMLQPEERYAKRAFQAGADGYLDKRSISGELQRAIEAVVQGRRYLSKSLTAKLMTPEIKNTLSSPHKRLSNREYQVMCLIASGCTVSEIARKLSLSVSTISTYRSRLLQKMDLKNNAEIIYYAVKKGLVD